MSQIKQRCQGRDQKHYRGTEHILIFTIVVAFSILGLRHAVAQGGSPSRTVMPDPVTVHAFYYPWYGNIETDGQWVHWHQNGQRPPQTFAAPQRPALDLYSSNDPETIEQHTRWMSQAGIDVAVYSWWGPGGYEDRSMPLFMQKAAETGIGVALHIEPYLDPTTNRRARPMRIVADLEQWLDRWAEHPASQAARLSGAADDTQGQLPIYIYHVLDFPPQVWRNALKTLGGRRDDLLIIGQTTDAGYLTAGGFDAGYNYDILPGFRDHGWLDHLFGDLYDQFAHADMLLVPCIGPGYDDDIATGRLGNEPDNSKTRDNGQYTTYRHAWLLTSKHQPRIVAITSFNEWHEGSQIESNSRHGRTDDYALRLTARLIEQVHTTTGEEAVGVTRTDTDSERASAR